MLNSVLIVYRMGRDHSLLGSAESFSISFSIHLLLGRPIWHFPQMGYWKLITWFQGDLLPKQYLLSLAEGSSIFGDSHARIKTHAWPHAIKWFQVQSDLVRSWIKPPHDTHTHTHTHTHTYIYIYIYIYEMPQPRVIIWWRLCWLHSCCFFCRSICI